MRGGDRSVALLAVLVVLFVAGVLMLFVASSHGVQGAGFIILFCVASVAVLARAPLKAAWHRSVLGLRRPKDDPESIEQATTYEDVSASEQERYNEAQDERDEG